MRQRSTSGSPSLGSTTAILQPLYPLDDGRPSVSNPVRGERPDEQPTEPPSPTSTPDEADVEGILVQGDEWTLEPERVSTTVDEEHTITFENVGEVAYDLTIGAYPLSDRDAESQAEDETFMAQTETIQSGETTTLTVTPEQTGEFPMWCDVAGHRDAGMEDVLVVEV